MNAMALNRFGGLSFQVVVHRKGAFVGSGRMNPPSRLGSSRAGYFWWFREIALKRAPWSVTQLGDLVWMSLRY